MLAATMSTLPGRHLEDTTPAAIAEALAHSRSGMGAAGMALTLVVDTDRKGVDLALAAAQAASREHPCRVLVVRRSAPASRARLDAVVRSHGTTNAGETVVLSLRGELTEHADAVVLPLLAPDSPVVIWWPAGAPDVPAETSLGSLAQRRVTDAAAESDPRAALVRRAAGYCDGDTDLAWTRLTPWRTLLAAALDQPYDPIASAVVRAPKANPSADLLVAWLGLRLDVPVTRTGSRGPGITEVRLAGPRGDIVVSRPDGVRAQLARPGSPERSVALARRDVPDLLAEELRRLDHDEPYAETLATLRPVRRTGRKK
jgi:glucose-6-phosphate dehydrogenase assembly protein OpcA